MEYAMPGCWGHFTEGQFNRIRACIMTEFVSRGIAVLGSPVRYQAAQPAGFQYGNEVPYSCVLLDYNNDNIQDMFIALPNANSELYRCTGVDEQTGLPIFEIKNNDDFFPGDAPPEGLHGLSTCDFDGNEHDDIFACAEIATTARLYQFIPELGMEGQFKDVTEEVGLLPYIDDSWCAAWVVYDEDNELDLLIGRADHTGTGYGPDDFGFLNDPVYLLRNDYLTSGQFVDCTEEAGLGSIQGAFISVTSEDFDHDDDMDIVLSNIIDYSGGGVGSLVMYLNNGRDGTYTHASLPDRIPDQELIQAVSGASFADLDGDRDMDLVLSSQSNYGHEPWVLFNAGNGFFYMQPYLRLKGTGKTQGLCLYNHDDDDFIDILLLPASDTDHPWLFTNKESLDTHVFVDESATVGLTDAGSVNGAVAYNWGSQGYPDLYFGRPINASDPRHYYQALDSGGSSGMTNNWIGFRLVATGANNASSIGAHVTVTYDNRSPMQTIDGGSGRGGQRSRELSFGLGEWSNGVDVTVEWPNGYVQNESYSFAELNQVHSIADMTDPGLDDSTVNCTTRLMPGGLMRWTFTWDTEYRTFATRDTLLISGPGFDDPSVFTADAGSITKNPDGTYAHRIAFTRLCKTGVFPYTVSSSTDSIQSSCEAGRNKRVTICSSF